MTLLVNVLFRQCCLKKKVVLVDIDKTENIENLPNLYTRLFYMIRSKISIAKLYDSTEKSHFRVYPKLTKKISFMLFCSMPIISVLYSRKKGTLLILPKILELISCELGVYNRVVNIRMSRVHLDRSSVMSFVC